MHFPPSDRIVFQKNPLEEVICQLRFPTILEIGAQAPDAFQNQIRDEYPVYERTSEFPFPPDVANILRGLTPTPSPEAVTHSFRTADGTRAITLAPNFVAVSERDYREWGLFRAEVERAQAALAAIYRPAFFDRVGLRYVDVIDRAKLGIEGRPWRDLITDPLSGLLAVDEQFEAGVQSTRHETVIALDHPDGAKVTLRSGLVDDARNVFNVDADFFVEERKDGNVIFDVLDLFNNEAGNLFRWTIRPPLKAALGVAHDD